MPFGSTAEADDITADMNGLITYPLYVEAIETCVWTDEIRI